MDTRQREEGEWIARCLKGERDAYRFLVQRYERMVRSVIRRLIVSEMEVDDLAQAAFITAYESLEQFAGSARFSTWLCEIALNKSRDWLRGRQRRQANIDEDAQVDSVDVGDPSDGPERRAELTQRDARLQAALARLRPGEREVIVLKYVEGHDYETVARLLNCGVEAAKLRSFRARDALKQVLLRMGIEL